MINSKPTTIRCPNDKSGAPLLGNESTVHEVRVAIGNWNDFGVTMRVWCRWCGWTVGRHFIEHEDHAEQEGFDDDE